MIESIKHKVISKLNVMFPVTFAKIRYRKWFGKNLDLKNPIDINAKMLWEALYADTTEWSRLADKYAVREFVEERGLKEILIPLLGKWDIPEDINWESLPSEFILKTNNGSGTNIIVKNKKECDFNEIKDKLKSFLEEVKLPRASEFHYQAIKPCIIAEKLLHNSEYDEKISASLIDYKIWCFNGQPYSFFIGTNRIPGSVEFHSYDLNWKQHKEHMIYDHKYHREPKSILPKPKNFDRMIEIAAILSKGFPIVRVDLYNINGKIYFGEMTFTSNGGIQSFYTMEYAEELGSQISNEELFKTKKK